MVMSASANFMAEASRFPPGLNRPCHQNSQFQVVPVATDRLRTDLFAATVT